MTVVDDMFVRLGIWARINQVNQELNDSGNFFSNMSLIERDMSENTYSFLKHNFRFRRKVRFMNIDFKLTWKESKSDSEER